MELANMDLEDYEKETQQKKEDTESGKYNEPTDYNASQESIGTLGEKMAEIHGSEILDKEGEDKDVEIKRSLRNKGKEDKKIEDMAKSRAEERDNYGKNSELVIADASLLHIGSLVGIDLGCSIEMIDKNIDIINKMEIARRELYFQNIKREKVVNQGGNVKRMINLKRMSQYILILET